MPTPVPRGARQVVNEWIQARRTIGNGRDCGKPTEGHVWSEGTARTHRVPREADPLGCVPSAICSSYLDYYMETPISHVAN